MLIHVFHYVVADTTEMLLMERDNESTIIEFSSLIALDLASASVCRLAVQSIVAVKMWRKAKEVPENNATSSKEQKK